MRSLLALLLTLAAASAQAAEPPLADFAVHVGRIDDRKAVFATVETVRRTMARARIGGTVAEVTVSEGDPVAAGQKIAAVGDPKLAMQLDANDQRMRSQQANRDQAASDLRRAQELFSAGTVSKARLEQAQTALQVAERGLAALAAERGVAGQQLSEGAVLAPVSGRVLEVPVSVGSVVMPGDTVAVVAAENYILRARIPERHARFIHAGGTVTVGELEPEEPLGLQGKTMARISPREGVIRKVYPEISDGRVTADIDVPGLGDYFVGERVRVRSPPAGARPSWCRPGYRYHRFGLTFVRLKDRTEVMVQARPDRPRASRCWPAWRTATSWWAP